MANDERIEHCFKFMEYDALTDRQHDIIVSLEEQYEGTGTLTDKQVILLESIFEQAAEK